MAGNFFVPRIARVNTRIFLYCLFTDVCICIALSEPILYHRFTAIFSLDIFRPKGAREPA
jgi:hypothetical protein